jgi:SOS-response transcriptional repressor LexA
MKNFGDRLKAALKHAQMTQQELATRVGISQQLINYATSPRAQGSKHSLQMANALGVSAEWLSSGNGEMLKNIKYALNDDLFVAEAGGSYLLSPGAPLIDWEDINTLDDKKSAPRIPCPINHGPNTYATVIKTDSMTATHGPSYPKGCTIFIDPDQAETAEAGSRVIAKLEGGNISFKQLNEDDGNYYLQSLNTSKQIPIIDKGFEIIGVVIGMWTPETKNL